MIKIKLIAFLYQLMGWERRDTIEGGLASGGDVYCIDLWKPTYKEQKDWEDNYGVAEYLRIPSFLCSNKKQLKHKLNDYIHTIDLKECKENL